MPLSFICVRPLKKNQVGLTEIQRVIKPGGILLCSTFEALATFPQTTLQFYFRFILPVIAGLFRAINRHTRICCGYCLPDGDRFWHILPGWFPSKHTVSEQLIVLHQFTLHNCQQG